MCVHIFGRSGTSSISSKAPAQTGNDRLQGVVCTVAMKGRRGARTLLVARQSESTWALQWDAWVLGGERLKLLHATSSFLLLVVRPGATSSVLAPFVVMPFVPQVLALKVSGNDRLGGGGRLVSGSRHIL